MLKIAFLVAHVILKIALHFAALRFLFGTTYITPNKQYPNAKTYCVQYHRRLGIQGAHKSARGNKAGKYQINEGFHV